MEQCRGNIFTLFYKLVNAIRPGNHDLLPTKPSRLGLSSLGNDSVMFLILTVLTDPNIEKAVLRL